MKPVALALCAALATAAAPAARADAPGGVSIVEVTRQKVLVKQVTAPPQKLRAAIRKAVTDATNAAKRSRLDIAGPPVVRYIQRGPLSFVVEAGVPVQGSAPARPGLRIVELPAGKAATITHMGPYEQLPATHQILDQWLEAQKQRATGRRWEVFVSNPVVVRDPAKLETKIFVPL